MADLDNTNTSSNIEEEWVSGYYVSTMFNHNTYNRYYLYLDIARHVVPSFRYTSMLAVRSLGTTKLRTNFCTSIVNDFDPQPAQLVWVHSNHFLELKALGVVPALFRMLCRDDLLFHMSKMIQVTSKTDLVFTPQRYSTTELQYLETIYNLHKLNT